MSNDTIESEYANDAMPDFDLSMIKESKNRIMQLESIVSSSDSIIHDINNQLSAIVAMTDLLARSTETGDDAAKRLHRITDSAKNIAVLTEKWQMLVKGYSIQDAIFHQRREDSARANGNSEKKDSRSIVREVDGPLTGGDVDKAMHILLVDDEEVVCAATEQMLKRLEYEVTSVRSGAAALSIFQDNWKEIDLVILDMMMPEMGGPEVFSHMRELNPNVNVLVSSGYSDNDKARELTDLGARGYIQKPFRLAQLSEKVRSIFES